MGSCEFLLAGALVGRRGYSGKLIWEAFVVHQSARSTFSEADIFCKSRFEVVGPSVVKGKLAVRAALNC